LGQFVRSVFSSGQTNIAVNSTKKEKHNMAAVPLIFGGVFYPKNKMDKPEPGTFIGNAYISGLTVGGGPIEPPPDINPDPPLVIWGGPFDPPPHPEHPIAWPPGNVTPIPPVPPKVEPPHEGWNWSAAKSGWYYLHVPGPDEAQPK
jgi:hypothetical protein